MKFLNWFLFNLWYFRKPPWDTGISPPELLHFIHENTPGRALDLGCGTGTNAITLARQGWETTGIDFALPAIRAARRKAAQAGLQINFKVGDVSRLEGITGTFNLILDIGCYHSLPPGRRQAYQDNLPVYLAPGGSFLLYVFRKDTGENHPGLTEGDIDSIAERITLADRKDSQDYNQRPSSWLRFQK